MLEPAEHYRPRLLLKIDPRVLHFLTNCLSRRFIENQPRYAITLLLDQFQIVRQFVLILVFN